jgi:polyhydroxybutyrate depolymerase
MHRIATLAAAALFLGGSAQAGTTTIDAGRGPITVEVPSSYDGSEPTPVIILLHGYSSSGAVKEAEYQITPLAEELGFLYLYPDGTPDFFGNRYWNATDACCDLFGGNPDDSTYLRDVIAEMQAQFNVDARRIHFFGHSNGGFMSYRMACDHADTVASIATLAGATWSDESQCDPLNPVHVLQMHGTADDVISYTGGCIPLGGCHPGAVETVETWAIYDGCTLVTDTSAPNVDLDAGIPGAETTVVRYLDQCGLGGSAELWTIPGGAHSPPISDDFSRLAVEWLLDHPKPAPFEPCTADIASAAGNGIPDGNVDALDFLLLIGQWGTPCAGSCEADVTGPALTPDGNVDALDYLLLISQWGTPGNCPSP